MSEDQEKTWVFEEQKKQLTDSIPPLFLRLSWIQSWQLRELVSIEERDWNERL